LTLSRPNAPAIREHLALLAAAALVLFCLIGASLAARRYKAEPLVRGTNPIPQNPAPRPAPKQLRPELIS
jgi:hypothetical protein